MKSKKIRILKKKAKIEKNFNEAKKIIGIKATFVNWIKSNKLEKNEKQSVANFQKIAKKSEKLNWNQTDLSIEQNAKKWKKCEKMKKNESKIAKNCQKKLEKIELKSNRPLDRTKSEKMEI